MKKDYRILLFDLDGVILDFKRAEQQSFRETFLRFGFTPDADLFSRYLKINERRWKAFEDGEMTKEECTVGRFTELFSGIGFSGDAAQFAKEYQDGLGDGHFLMPHAREVLEALSPRFALYVVTNGVSSTAYRRLRGTDTERYFRKIFVSEELKAQKPSMAYFRQVFADIPDFSRERALLIGDSLSSDIQGAENAGIDCCYVNLGHKKNETALRPTYEIDDLRALLTILETV